MNKIDKIEYLLNNDEEFDKYINLIENNNISVPEDLNNKIKFKIEKSKKKYYIDVCKIAACLVFGLIICRTDFIKNDDFKYYEYEIKSEKSEKQEKISEICEFLTTPINKERNEK